MNLELAHLLLFGLYAITTVILVLWTRRSTAEAKRAADAAEQSGSAAEQSAAAAHESADAAKELVSIAREDKREEFIRVASEQVERALERGSGGDAYQRVARFWVPLMDQMPHSLQQDAKEILRAGYARFHGMGGSFVKTWAEVEEITKRRSNQASD